mmetsp:Transcript_118290/g.339432  ORF Transcript_118290/g.339432 Transcript_118290/m.339432 type:complete len:186 (+) Transcript_118290:119-676(+)
MSDLKWGFEKAYGHRSLPPKWHSSGFNLYDPNPLLKKSFRRPGMPVHMEDTAPRDTDYAERPQTSRDCMSAYGVHLDKPWGNSLRSPRNPFPGRVNRETKYTQEPSPASTPRKRWSSSVPAMAGRGITAPDKVRYDRLQELQQRESGRGIDMYHRSGMSATMSNGAARDGHTEAQAVGPVASATF